MNEKQQINMTKQDYDILNCLYLNKFTNQREIAKLSGYSLGSVNNSIKNLMAAGFLNKNSSPTELVTMEYEAKKPQHAIILAAGCGMRMIPFNNTNPKGLLDIDGEKLIERLISQLKQAGVEQIHIVVGFMKEKYEYLMDKFGVELIVNDSYFQKNNLHSLYLASRYLENAYILPCDIWCQENPFSEKELYSWYMLANVPDFKSFLSSNRKMNITANPKLFGGLKMLGISYITAQDAPLFRAYIEKTAKDPMYDDITWEEAVFKVSQMNMFAKEVNPAAFAEINTYEQLRELSRTSKQLQSGALETICNVFHVKTEDIKDIKVLKKGMTNKSFMFTCRGCQYIMRIPGEGTDKLIDRAHEAEVYKAISGCKLCDDPVYINPENGYKITRYIKNAMVANPKNIVDVKLCMRKLKSFHNMKLKVSFEFDLYKMIDFYESLWNGDKSLYSDYGTTKTNVLSLRPFIEANAEEKVLTHIDSVPDNFLFDPYKIGELGLQLTDWEYAGMQDPHVDIAMFCIYSLYDKKHVDKLINAYFGGKCNPKTHAKIYCYIATCGLLWSNWCEYKRKLGVEFGEYSLRQYRYAKDYYKYAIEEIKAIEDTKLWKGVKSKLTMH